MAAKKEDKKVDEGEEQPKKKSGLVPSIIAVVVLSAIAVGAGWFVASQKSPSKMASVEKESTKKAGNKKPKKAHDKDKGDSDHGDGDAAELYAEENVFTKFEPFIVNLPLSGNSLVRLELGMLAESGYSIERPATQAEIVSGISTYLKTVELELYSGPSGYLHLREDLLERAQLTSDGKVRKVFILSMAVE